MLELRGYSPGFQERMLQKAAVVEGMVRRKQMAKMKETYERGKR